jgi:hypothetical protein
MRLCVTANASVAALNPSTMQADAIAYCSLAAGAEVCPARIKGETRTKLGAERMGGRGLVVGRGGNTSKGGLSGASPFPLPQGCGFSRDLVPTYSGERTSQVFERMLEIRHRATAGGRRRLRRRRPADRGGF